MPCLASDCLLLILPEGIYDVNPLDLSRFLQVFGEEYFTASLLSHAQDQRIPERKPVKAVKVDSSQYVSKLGSSDVELGKQFHFAASY